MQHDMFYMSAFWHVGLAAKEAYTKNVLNNNNHMKTKKCMLDVMSMEICEVSTSSRAIVHNESQKS